MIRENKLKIFTHETFGNVRTVEMNDKVYFMGKDIASVLGYKNTNDAINKHCRWIAKYDIPHPQSENKTIEVSIIPEGDVYRLIANSKLPKAEQFEKWVFDEVLPQIRQTGGYIPVKEEDDEESILAKAILISQKTIAKKDEIIAQKDGQIELLKPKAEKFDDFLNAENAQTMLEVAKTLDIGRNTLMRFLRIKKIFMSNNMPYAKYCGRDLFRTREFTIKKKNGSTINCCQTFSMPKGLNWISDIIKEELGGLLQKETTGQIKLKI